MEVDNRVRKQFRHFAPDVCQAPFPASRFRIELDTRAVADWNEIDYVEVTGALEARVGAYRATQRFTYVPDPGFCGGDAFRFHATDCGFAAGRDSDPSDALLRVAAVTADCARRRRKHARPT